MKRFALSFSTIAGVQVVVLFALTARPARLYAESAPPDGSPPLSSCDQLAPDGGPCSGKSYGEICALPGAPDGGLPTACFPAQCAGADGGASQVLNCEYALPTCSDPTFAACAGKVVGDPCSLVPGLSGTRVCALEQPAASQTCLYDDGGFYVWAPTLTCTGVAAATPTDAGPDAGDADAGGLVSVGVPGSDAASNADLDAGPGVLEGGGRGTPASGGGGGCAVSSVPGGGTPGWATLFLFAAGAAIGRRRRPR